MNWEPQDERSIRSYLLKTASPEEEQTVEETMLRDDDYAVLVEMIEDEMIDDYVRGVMPAAERKRFTERFTLSPTRRQKLMIAQAALENSSTKYNDAVERVKPSLWSFLFLPSWKPIAVLFASVVIAAFAYWEITKPLSEIERGTRALNQAFSRERMVSVRISDLDYAPYSVRMGNEAGRVDLTALDRAKRHFLDALVESPNADSHHALGRLYLAQKKIDQAIGEFETALRLEPNNSKLHADLGAALLEKSNTNTARRNLDPASSDHNVDIFKRSLEHLNRALSLSESQHEALFNRALLRQSQGDLTGAKDDWKLYLQKDSTSHWAVEARGHLAELGK